MDQVEELPKAQPIARAAGQLAIADRWDKAAAWRGAPLWLLSDWLQARWR